MFGFGLLWLDFHCGIHSNRPFLGDWFTPKSSSASAQRFVFFHLSLCHQTNGLILVINIGLIWVQHSQRNIIVIGIIVTIPCQSDWTPPSLLTLLLGHFIHL